MPLFHRDCWPDPDERTGMHGGSLRRAIPPAPSPQPPTPAVDGLGALGCGIVAGLVILGLIVLGIAALIGHA